MLNNKKGRITMGSFIFFIIGVVIVLVILRWIGFDMGHFKTLWYEFVRIFDIFASGSKNIL